MKVLITGASGNIGKAVYQYYYDHVDTIGECEFTGVARREAEVMRNKIQRLDLSRSWDYLRLWCRTQRDAFDLVIMAHGTQIPATLKTMTEDQWYSIWYNNLSSVVALTQALVKEDKLAPGSLIIYCSSIQAYTPRAGRGLYAACKAGVEAFGKTVAAELAPNTRCITLRLGQLTETMGGVVFSAEERAKLEQRALLPWVEPADVATLCFSLYNQPSMTGCVIDVDSGHGRNVW